MAAETTLPPVQEELSPERKHFRRLGYLLAFSSLMNIMLALVVLAGTILVAITFNTKPIIISELYSVPRWHRVQDFHLKYDYIDTFLKITTGAIFNHSSKDMIGLGKYEPLISPFAQNLYKQEFYNTFDPRAYKWQRWEIIRIKRYVDPLAPSSLLAFVVEGMITKVDGGEVSKVIKMKVDPKRVFYLFYVAQIPPNFSNPFGLVLAGFREVKERSQQRLIYDQSVEVIGSPDVHGRPIVPSNPILKSPLSSTPAERPLGL